MPPGTKVAVLACMDARLDPARALGLEEGDAHVIRNAVGMVSERQSIAPHQGQPLRAREDGDPRVRLRGGEREAARGHLTGGAIATIGRLIYVDGFGLRRREATDP